MPVFGKPVFKKKTPFKAAFDGLKIAFKTQKHIRLHLLSALWVIAAGFFLQVSLMEWSALLLAIALVIGLELLNTAIEHLCDFVHPGYATKIGAIKDISAAAVLSVSLFAAATGLIIFLPKVIDLFK